MCSYNITLDDTLVKNAKPAFADDNALLLWLQQQVEWLLVEHIAAQRGITPPCQYTEEEASQRIIQATAEVDAGIGLVSHEEFKKQVRSWYK